MKTKQAGFTLIELLILLVVVGVLGTLVAMTYSGVQAKNNNLTRKSDINIIENRLETYYAENNNSKYPALSELNDVAWRSLHMPTLAAGTVRDPRWSASVAVCTHDGQAIFAASPKADCYSYQVSSATGDACNNSTVVCAHYTLTAKLEGGGSYVQSSLN